MSVVTTRTRLSKTRSKLVIAVIIYHAYYYSLSGTSNCSAMATITVSLLNRFVSSTGHRLGLGNFNYQRSFAFPGFSTYRRAARIRSSGGGFFSHSFGGSLDSGSVLALTLHLPEWLLTLPHY